MDEVIKHAIGKLKYDRIRANQEALNGVIYGIYLHQRFAVTNVSFSSVFHDLHHLILAEKIGLF